MNILIEIVASKKQEIRQLYQQHDPEVLKSLTLPTLRSFEAELSSARSQRRPFFITEFKRKSPSEDWIDRDANLAEQIELYARAGAGAISVLTDTPFFGGTYDDLRRAAVTLSALPEGAHRPLLLQKDFVLDPIQIYLARQAGADLILLIAAILSAEQLEALRQTAASLGMGALIEVHDAGELEKVQHLNFPVLGINNRDLKTFRTALNRVNVLARAARGRYVIAESGLHHARDFRIVRRADGFLIGTSLMRHRAHSEELPGEQMLQTMFAPRDHRPLLKACGIRTADLLTASTADWIGINFSPMSKRRINLAVLDQASALPANAVAVFYKNSIEEVNVILAQYPFKTVQLYAGDMTPEQVRSIKKKVILAVSVRSEVDLKIVEDYASDVDMFILDGAAPGSGQRIGANIPGDFPYPFLLAGGIHLDNLDLIRNYQNCIGVDIASGIETDGMVDSDKIREIRETLG